MRRCSWCRRPLAADARSTARYCSVQHRRAAYRLRRAALDALALLDGSDDARWESAEQFAATRRAVARAARIGDGRGGARTPHTDAATARREAVHA